MSLELPEGSYVESPETLMVPVDFLAASLDDDSRGSYRESLMPSVLPHGSKPVVSTKTISGSESTMRMFSHDIKVATLAAEVAAIAALQHPNIVKIVSVLEGEDAFAMVQEPISLTLILQFSRQKQQTQHQKDGEMGEESGAPKQRTPDDELLFDRETILGWVFELASALSYLHGQVTPLLHRNIRPNSCYIDSGGALKLGNFEDSVFLYDEFESGMDPLGRKKFKLHAGLGSSRYSAPETRHQGSEGEDGSTGGSKMLSYNEASDVFSMGTTTYFIVTGCHPFNKEGSTSVEKRYRKGERPSLDVRCIRDLDDGATRLKSMLGMCWAQDASRRPRIGDVLKSMALLIPSKARGLSFGDKEGGGSRAPSLNGSFRSASGSFRTANGSFRFQTGRLTLPTGAHPTIPTGLGGFLPEDDKAMKP